MFSFIQGFRDNKVAKDVCRLIERLAGDRRIRIVHVCGTHEDTITKYGLGSLLPENVEVLRAIIYPQDCPLFNAACTPETPVGPCMVSTEASCYIAAKYGGEKFR